MCYNNVMDKKIEKKVKRYMKSRLVILNVIVYIIIVGIFFFEFKQKKMHLAMVVNEHGTVIGLVTIEDLLEEIVGEINDEFDDEIISHSKMDQNTYVFEGKTSLNDFCKEKLFDLEVDVLFDILLSNNIIIKKGEGYAFKASFWILFFALHK